MADLKELLKINGSDAIAEIRLVEQSKEVDADGQKSYSKRVDQIYSFQLNYDQHGNHGGYSKIAFTRSQIMDMYNAIKLVEDSEPIKRNPADLDDDLPW